MAGREVREYTNLSDPKDKKWGKGKDKIDDEDVTFQRMVAKMQEVAGERGGYLHGRGALDSDDLLYLKEQMEAEEDAERLLRRTEKRAFAAFKISFRKFLQIVPPLNLEMMLALNLFSLISLTIGHKAASLVDSSPASVPLPLRVEPKPKSGIRQQDLLKKVVEIKPKRHRVSSPSDGNQSTPSDSAALTNLKSETKHEKEKEHSLSKLDKTEGKSQVENPVKSLLGLAYASSDDEE
ncbi:ankyrin repeat protein [Trema orientale]|uniref:Ankyrin repeat protein n=1 Tax=Trema orientale TaxID=63057 RepID=A0A2P5BXT1_TREOI|nr:ankyrin repeat protein [Trema orientale]